MNRPPLKPGDVYPSHVLRDEYGMNAANRPTIVVDAAQVPEPLRCLIPNVERWAIPCDVTRGDYFEQQPEEDIAWFWYDVLPYSDAINQWLDSQPADVQNWPAAAVHFMYFLKAHQEAWQPTEEEKKEMEKRQAEWARQRSRNDAIARGSQAFKDQDYRLVIETLEPFAGELDKVVTAKLVHAKKAVEG